jgi:hypothetical protein
MNVVLHGWPDDPKAKRMHQTKTSEYQDKIIVPIMVQQKTSAINYDLIYSFIYHDGTYYHYGLFEPEFWEAE